MSCSFNFNTLIVLVHTWSWFIPHSTVWGIESLVHHPLLMHIAGCATPSLVLDPLLEDTWRNDEGSEGGCLLVKSHISVIHPVTGGGDVGL
jgi:hypothetical protein